MRRFLADINWIVIVAVSIAALYFTIYEVNKQICASSAEALTDQEKFRLTNAIIRARVWGTNCSDWDWARSYAVDLDHDGWGTIIQYVDDIEYDGFILCKTAGPDKLFGTVDDFNLRLDNKSNTR